MPRSLVRLPWRPKEARTSDLWLWGGGPPFWATLMFTWDASPIQGIFDKRGGSGPNSNPPLRVPFVLSILHEGFSALLEGGFLFSHRPFFSAFWDPCNLQKLCTFQGSVQPTQMRSGHLGLAGPLAGGWHPSFWSDGMSPRADQASDGFIGCLPLGGDRPPQGCWSRINDPLVEEYASVPGCSGDSSLLKGNTHVSKRRFVKKPLVWGIGVQSQVWWGFRSIPFAGAELPRFLFGRVLLWSGFPVEHLLLNQGCLILGAVVPKNGPAQSTVCCARGDFFHFFFFFNEQH